MGRQASASDGRPRPTSAVALLAALLFAGCPQWGPFVPGSTDGTDAGADLGGTPCGSSVCTGPHDVCCADPDLHCTATCGGIRLTCDGPEDCAAGDACCWGMAGTTPSGSTGCEACALNPHLCHGPGDCDGASCVGCQYLGVDFGACTRCPDGTTPVDAGPPDAGLP